MSICETPRLRLREFVPHDAPFMLRLLNDPGFIANINDKGIRTVDAAREFLEVTLIPSYMHNGFGLWAVDRKDTGDTIGMCGLIKRDWLDDIDLGYALLEDATGAGFAREAALATLGLAQGKHKLTRLAAIVNADNERSIRLLRDLGFVYERIVKLPPDDFELPLYAWVAPNA